MIRVKLTSVLFPEAFCEGLEELIRTGMYASRSSATRASVRDLLKRELWQREREKTRKKVVRTKKKSLDGPFSDNVTVEVKVLAKGKTKKKAVKKKQK